MDFFIYKFSILSLLLSSGSLLALMMSLILVSRWVQCSIRFRKLKFNCRSSSSIRNDFNSQPDQHQKENSDDDGYKNKSHLISMVPFRLIHLFQLDVFWWVKNFNRHLILFRRSYFDWCNYMSCQWQQLWNLYFEQKWVRIHLPKCYGIRLWQSSKFFRTSHFLFWFSKNCAILI